MSPRVSIIIPSYNHGRFIRQCLQRVVDQTFTDWELIIVDDGSKDDSVAMSRAFDDPRIQVHQNEVNLGTYGTEQKALSMSKGEFIAVLNSDDLWEVQKLERQVHLLERYPKAMLCYTLGWKIDDEGNIDTSEDVHLDWPTDELQDVLPYLMYENRILASGVLFRRGNLKFETTCRYSGDWVALLEQAKQGPVACLSDRLTYWRMHNNNTFVLSPKQLAEEVRVRRAIAELGAGWTSDPKRLPGVLEGLGKNSLNLSVLAVFFGDRAAAMFAGFTAIRFMANKKRAIKRTLSLLLPMGYLKKYFWSAADLKKLNVPQSELKKLLEAQPKLDLNR